MSHRITIEVSAPTMTTDTLAITGYVAAALGYMAERGIVVHRIEVEEDDA